ncbi:DUF982 domain-containing protein [Metarhizobium album]|uniref:DUF982 domain-containing protein n=1 Tax=Metarhizobium album TaxID=2182425 RepID=A0A2U2DFV6_9HYPH|nr:DUF982 domain-containing protein [Rhizobium album]PWE52121.1 DUF982 domain-containing protein [Rhizobium album]
MSTELWHSKIEVTTDCGNHFKNIGNSRDALAFLIKNWPNRGGRSYAAAKKACIEALHGRVKSSVAAEAFKLAAAEAGIIRV